MIPEEHIYFDPFDPDQVSALPDRAVCKDGCKAKMEAWIDPANGWGCWQDGGFNQYNGGWRSVHRDSHGAIRERVAGKEDHHTAEQFDTSLRQGRMNKIGMKKLTANPKLRRYKQLPVHATTSTAIVNTTR
jgi:hypothetical protein